MARPRSLTFGDCLGLLSRSRCRLAGDNISDTSRAGTIIHEPVRDPWCLRAWPSSFADGGLGLRILGQALSRRESAVCKEGTKEELGWDGRRCSARHGCFIRDELWPPFIPAISGICYSNGIVLWIMQVGLCCETFVIAAAELSSNSQRRCLGLRDKVDVQVRTTRTGLCLLPG